jgi:dihydroorotate dehydrogenase (NAD+) catalytic subunit
MVHQVSKAVQIPVMGLGGISTWQDAVEFLMAGARVIQVGTATFTNPKIALNIIDGLEKYLESQNLESVEDIIGIL